METGKRYGPAAPLEAARLAHRALREGRSREAAAPAPPPSPLYADVANRLSAASIDGIESGEHQDLFAAAEEPTETLAELVTPRDSFEGGTINVEVAAPRAVDVEVAVDAAAPTAAEAEAEWAAFFAASVEAPPAVEAADAALAAAVHDALAAGEDYPPLTSESSPFWPPPPAIVSEAPRSPEHADAEFRRLKAGVVRSVANAAAARARRVRERSLMPGLPAPGTFASDARRDADWRGWHATRTAEVKLEFGYSLPLPGLVAAVPRSDSAATLDAAATLEAAPPPPPPGL